jgi:hypothetical protein
MYRLYKNQEKNMKLLLKMILIILFPVIFSSCILWGLEDNIIISKLDGQFDYQSKMFINGDYLFVTRPGDPLMGPQNGFIIIDISDPLSLEIVGSYSPPNDVWIKNIWVEGNYAYCLADALFLIVDISNPVVLSKISEINVAESGSLFIYDNYAYCANSSIINITDPIIPVEEGTLKIDNDNLYPSIGGVSGNELYSQDSDGLSILDISNPTSPSVITTETRPGEVPNGEIIVNNSTLYITNWFGDGDITVIDVSDSTNPVAGNSWKYSIVNALEIKDNILYVAGGRANFEPRVQLYDLTDPLNPRQLEYPRNVHETIFEIKLTDNFMYLLTQNSIIVCTRPGR